MIEQSPFGHPKITIVLVALMAQAGCSDKSDNETRNADDARYGGSSAEAGGGQVGRVDADGSGEATVEVVGAAGAASTGLGGSSGSGEATVKTPDAAGAANAGPGGAGASCDPGASLACACADGSLAPQVCQANGTYAPCNCLLAESKSKIVGSWAGTRTTIWDGSHAVTLKFTADGHYTTDCPDGCITMYWGTDTYSDNKTYEIAAVNSDGVGNGRISLVFSAIDVSEASMRSINFDATGNGLTFSVWKGAYGPVDFALARQ